MKDINSRIDKEKGVIYLTEKERTAQLIKPILRGRDIKRYGYEWDNKWLIFISWHFPNTQNPKSMQENEKDLEEQYPSLYNHLLQYKDRLSKRNKDETGIRYEWYCLQRWGANYYQEFAKPKIVWNPVSGEYFFSYLKEVMYFNNSLFMITHKQNKEEFLLFVLGLMNSTLYRFLITQMTNLIDEGKYAYGAKDKIENLPIPKITQSQEAEFIAIVREIIERKKSLENFNNEVYPHCNTIKTHEVQTSKALSGWGIDKGEGATSPNSSPSTLSKKEQNATLKNLESRLDSMVFSLYGLNDEEIELISNGGGGRTI